MSPVPDKSGAHTLMMWEAGGVDGKDLTIRCQSAISVIAVITLLEPFSHCTRRILLVIFFVLKKSDLSIEWQ